MYRTCIWCTLFLGSWILSEKSHGVYVREQHPIALDTDTQNSSGNRHSPERYVSQQSQVWKGVVYTTSCLPRAPPPRLGELGVVLPYLVFQLVRLSGPRCTSSGVVQCSSRRCLFSSQSIFVLVVDVDVSIRPVLPALPLGFEFCLPRLVKTSRIPFNAVARWRPGPTIRWRIQSFLGLIVVVDGLFCLVLPCLAMPCLLLPAHRRVNSLVCSVLCCLPPTDRPTACLYTSRLGLRVTSPLSLSGRSYRHRLFLGQLMCVVVYVVFMFSSMSIWRQDTPRWSGQAIAPMSQS